MANLTLGKDVANKKIASCSYCGQILSPTTNNKNASLRLSY